MRLKNIIFDMGGVLIEFTPLEDIRRWYGRTEAERLINFLFQEEYWLKLDDGSQSPEGLCNLLHGKEKILLEDFFSRYMGLMRPYDHSASVLDYCRERGKQLFFLTNFPDEAFGWLQETYSWFKKFDGGVVSSRVKLAKPDQAIYQLLCRQEKIKPEESLFIDDRADNIEAAAILGFQTHQLLNPENLTEVLKQKLS